MKGILADSNIRLHFAVLLTLFEAKSRRELWEHLRLTHPSFADLSLQEDEVDRRIWLTCQDQELVLITANRNDDDQESLENTIRSSNTAVSLPVITLADPDRFLRDKLYASTTADRILEILFDIDNFLGVGRLYVP